MGSKPSLIRPPRLQPNSRVALIAPAGPLLERDDLTRAEELCRALGYRPVLGQNAYSKYGYLAGTDDQRVEDLNWALTSRDVDAVWCIRGGFGMTRILDRVDYAGFARHPRVVIGYSDITALLLALHRHTGVVTFHGPMARAAMPPFSRWHFDRVLTQIGAAGQLGRIAPPADVLVPQKDRIVSLKAGTAEGRLVGGNLTLLDALIGTRHMPDLDGAILFLEDVGEDLYSVDRMLAHLRMAGALEDLAGVAVGRFTDMDRSSGDGALGFDEVLATYLEPLGVPVVYGFPIGHIDDQWTVPIGVKARLDAERGEVWVLDPAVE
jgi:muramoyltetrapeptide carboxypeptidase